MKPTPSYSNLAPHLRNLLSSWTLEANWSGSPAPNPTPAKTALSSTNPPHKTLLPSSLNPPPLPNSSAAATPNAGGFHGPDFLLCKCPNCSPTRAATSCNQICPPYFLLYGSGSTGGVLLLETLVFPDSRRVENFVVGCSVASTRQPEGIAGFGRGPSSLPAQLRLARFAYCLLSRLFNYTANSSSLVLGEPADSGETKGLQFTRFLKNPAAGNPAFAVYYYVGLRKVTVGGRDVGIRRRFLRPGRDGSGGAIVDSGTSFTYMEGHVFEPVARAFEAELGRRYRRATYAESLTGLRPCFDVPGDKFFSSPKLVFHFKGGADMELPVSNYFVFVGGTDTVTNTVCLTIVTDGGGTASEQWPSVILGNFQQQNFYMEYELEKEKLGFRR